MNKSSWAPAAVLAVSVLCAAAPASAAAQDLPASAAAARTVPASAAAAPTAPAQAYAAQGVPQDVPQGAAGAPLDVTAGECIQGGGMIIIIADGTAPGGFSKTCQGGTHDGETII